MKAAAALCLLGALAIGGVWLAHGRLMGTRTETPVEVVTTDDFGDEVKTTRWEPKFELGLDYAGPGAGLLVVLAAGLFWRSRRA